MTGLRKAALAAITILVTVASVASFAESYRGLYIWASRHDLHGIWALAFPAQVDVFVAVGELALLVALADGWSKSSRTGAWAVTVIGLAVSVAANIGHVEGHSITTRATAAVPPLAAAAALAVGLGVLKRTVAKVNVPATDVHVLARSNGHDPEVLRFRPYLADGKVPGIRVIKRELSCGQPRAKQVQERLSRVLAGR